MKTPHLFCYLLLFITCCVFTWRAESTLSQELGYLGIIISMLFSSKSMIRRLDA
jgi:uncharacterized membrane protein YgaE (UPF0421/DUF939 family)